MKLEKIIEKPYFECKRCDKNSFKDEWCPCPRGGCEAENKGKIVIEKRVET